VNTPLPADSFRPILLVVLLSSLAPSTGFAQAAPVTAPPPTRAEDAVQLSAFTVKEDQDIGYESMQTTSGMRTPQELKNLANSISILNNAFINDIGALSVDEMMRWSVAGEDNPEGHNAQVDSRVVMRGIASAYAMRNGWIWYSPMDAYSTERVEVLRGPNSFLYGEADVGGAHNQITKRGLFGRDINRVRLVFGSDDLRRGEIDINRRIIKDKLAVRVAAVKSHQGSWIDNVRRDVNGIYAAATYRPFKKTQINISAEHAEVNSVNSLGLLLDQYSRTATAAVSATVGGLTYIPATGLSYRNQGTGRLISTGSANTITDPNVVPRSFHSAGPNATFENYYQSFILDVEQDIGENLHLQLSGSWYQRNIDQQAVGAGRTIFRDMNRLLPNGSANPYFGELYTEYFRTRREHGNNVKDIRLSLVYDWKPVKWMKQQFLVNVQQHQDNPYHRKPAWGEYIDESNPAFQGTINRDITQAAYTANRATFTNNRFMRRYYFQRDGTKGSDDMGPVPGVSAWYPDLSNAVGAAGHQLNRRFYTPSKGAGMSGTYFKGHLFTHVGYREDEFKMKTRFTTVRPLKDQWVVDEVPGLFPANQTFVYAKVHGTNYGGVLRLNETFAVGYNWAQSFRISTGEGADTHRVGEKQGVPIGEGTEISARFSLFPDARDPRLRRLEINLVKYDNFRPNDRFNPNPAVAVENELIAIFPTEFYAPGQDFQTTTTEGYELEMNANLTRNWRLTFNVGTNKVVTEDRAPILHGFQAAAKEKGVPTPLLDAFLLTFPEGVPNAGYTKARANIFTRYTFTEGALRGFHFGGGVNWRKPTYRGIADHDYNPATPTAGMWSPGYSLYSFLAGYSTRIMKRPTTFALNVSNVFDKDYYRAGGFASGSWGDPRAFRLTMSTDL
jgi:iron complex outermembrane receptor protein